MKPQTKPTPWSCIGTAFAMVLDISVSDLFAIVGHDGSEIAFPALPDPMARRGLHIQECIATCVKLGYAVTPVELFPVIQSPTPDENNTLVLFGADQSANWERFEQTIGTSTGVLEGVGRRCLHAVAYDRGMIFDPDGDHYPYSRPACESRGFRPRRAWRVDLLHSPSLNPFISEILRKDHAMSSYDHDLTNKIPKALDREQNERLYARVTEGDEKAREEMIESNMPLVINKVDSFIQQNPRLLYLRDDLHSAGFVGLVLAVNKMAEGSDISNPTGYISVAITHEFVKLAKKEAVHIGIELVDLPKIEMDLVSDVPEISHGIPESIVDTDQAATQHILELRDLLESCCESDKERTLLRMREEGCSDREIAEALDTSRTSIQALRKKLEKRFNQKCRELEED